MSDDHKAVVDGITNLVADTQAHKDLADHLLRRRQIVVNLGAETASPAAKHLLYVVDEDCRVMSFKVCSAVAVTASDTDYFTEQLVYNDLAAGADVAISDIMTTKVTGGAAYVAAIPKTFTGIAATGDAVAAGKGIYLDQTKGGAGKDNHRSCILTLEYGTR